ncbi:MAG: hypothetical protein ABWZ99_07280 [Ilumatobacteraceae bacterium]
MTETPGGRRRRPGAALALITMAVLAIASCGDDDDATTGTTAPPTSPPSPPAPPSSGAATSPPKPAPTDPPTMPSTTVTTTPPTAAPTTAPPPPPPTTVAVVATSAPAGPTAQPVLADGWCSPALVDFMVDESTSFEFVPGFAVPDVESDLVVGCSGTSPEVSFAGYIDTFTVIRNDPGVIDVIADRIRSAGYVDDPLADPAHPMFQTPDGDPIGFVTPLDMKAGRGSSDVVFQDAAQWVVVQFYLPGG